MRKIFKLMKSLTEQNIIAIIKKSFTIIDDDTALFIISIIDDDEIADLFIVSFIVDFNSNINIEYEF